MQIKTHLALFHRLPLVLILASVALFAWLTVGLKDSFDGSAITPVLILVALAAVAIGAVLMIAFPFVPARCPACQGAAYSSHPFFTAQTQPITYTCGTCGQKHRTRVLVGGD